VSLLTLTRDLRRRKAREKHTRCVVEGVRAVEELLAAPVRVVGALVGPELLTTARGVALFDELTRRGVTVESVDDREFASAADTDAPQGVLVVVETPQPVLSALPEVGTLVVLDGLQDPGNVGTILRTAAAFGAAGVVALPGTVDLWNAKVIRSAVGAHFRHPALHATWDELAAYLASQSLPLWAATMDGAAVSSVARSGRVAIAIGNEGAGVSPGTLAAASQRVTIPIGDGAESLNAAVAAGILLYLLRS
jgi:TrmH family RNA methyltransferase